METEYTRLVDENGEFEDVVIVRNPENKLILNKDNLKKVQAYQAEKKNYELFQDIAGGFTFMLTDTLKELHNDTRFNDMDKARIIFLGTFCSYETSGRYLLFNNNKPILKNNLQELLEITNKKEFYKFYNKLIETRIIEEERISRTEIKLKWNSKYHFKGKANTRHTSSTDTVKAYDRQIQELYKAKNAKGKNINTPKNLYILFMLLPYINTESGVLCRQQHIQDETACEPLELDDLAEMFGYSRVSMIKNQLLKCKLHGTNVFFIGEGMQNRKRYTRIFVNPFVANRSGKTPNASLLAMFPDTEKAIVNYIKEKQY